MCGLGLKGGCAVDVPVGMSGVQVGRNRVEIFCGVRVLEEVGVPWITVAVGKSPDEEMVAGRQDWMNINIKLAKIRHLRTFAVYHKNPSSVR